MKLSKTSWHHKLYNYTHKNPAPHDLCSYFWGLVIGIVTLPILPIGYIKKIYMTNKDFGERLFTNFCLYTSIFLSWAAGRGTMLNFCGWDNSYMQHPLEWFDLVNVLFGASVIVLGFFIFMVFVGTIVFFAEVISDFKYKISHRSSTPKQPNILRQWIKAKKDKNCPMIDWEE